MFVVILLDSSEESESQRFFHLPMSPNRRRDAVEKPQSEVRLFRKFLELKLSARQICHQLIRSLDVVNLNKGKKDGKPLLNIE